MESPDTESRPVRIAVIRALGGLGDILCAIPALRALRAAHPEAHVSLIGLPDARWVLDRFDRLVDSLLPFPGFPGFPGRTYSAARLTEFVARMRRRPFDLVMQMHGSGVASNTFALALGARSTAGFYLPKQGRPRQGRFFPYPDRGAEVHRCLYLTTSLGMPARNHRVSFPVTATDRAQLAKHAMFGTLSEGSYVCIHAGARDAARRWAAEHFARVADVLARGGYRVVLTGTRDERATADAVAALMQSTPINAAGKTSLGVLAALLERAALLVTNDTGVSHLAAALSTPSVVVFVASDPERWAPLDRALHRVVAARRGTGGHRSAAKVPDADEVVAEAMTALGRGVAA